MGKRALTLTLALTSALVGSFPPAAGAFHDGGVGACDGCHDLHASEGDPEGLATNFAPSASAELLLRGDDLSSTCLRCHAELGEPYNVMSDDGSSFNAGGDFYWLTRSYAWIEDGQPRASPADSHGHNPVAVEYGLTADGRLAVSPGGAYPASELSCVSCHDPHGQQMVEGDEGVAGSRAGYPAEASPGGAVAGNYRLLAGRGYTIAPAKSRCCIRT